MSFRSEKSIMAVCEHRRKARDNYGYTYGTTKNEHDFVTVALRFRPRTQAPTVHHGNSKGLKFPWRIPDYHLFSKIFTDHAGYIHISDIYIYIYIAEFNSYLIIFFKYFTRI